MENTTKSLILICTLNLGVGCGETLFSAETLLPNLETDGSTDEPNGGLADDGSIDVETDGGETDGSMDGGVDSGNINPPDEPVQYFANGFEGTTSLSFNGDKMWTLDGEDPNYPPISDWGEARSIGIFDKAQPRPNLIEYADYAIIDDPDPNAPNNHVFMMHTIADDESTGSVERSQLQMTPKTAVGPVKSFFTKLRWFIPEDYEDLKDMPGGHKWMVYFEVWWNNLDICPEAGSTLCNPAGSFRASFYFEERDESDQWQWRVTFEDMEGEPDEREKQWYYQPNVTVPFGEWLEMEFYVVEGEDPDVNPDSPARFLAFMHSESLGWQTLFDISDAHILPKGGAEGIKILHPFKNYMNPDNIEYLNEDGREAKMYYDDIQIWDQCPEGSQCYAHINPVQ